MAAQQSQASARKQKGKSPSPRQDNGASTRSLEPAERDETYGLISVLYHALQGAETYTQYLADAEKAGESEIARFFEECLKQENARALTAKQLLATQLADFEADDEDDDEE